ncbi:MAG: hypothetical protein J6W64_01880 [Bacilli bacterium]|nr:hypothetical protein [Bacilli bacterium]
MENLVKNFKKVARIVVVICLFVLAAFEIVALVSEIGGGFFPSFVRILKTFLMLLMYLVPAILLAVKKDKEGFVVLSFLLGYLVIAKTLSFLSYGGLINKNLEALDIIRLIIFLVLGVLLALALICVYLNLGFKLNSMKLGNLLLVISLLIVFVCLIFNVVYMIVKDASFKDILNSMLDVLITPLIVVFGLMLVTE